MRTCLTQGCDALVEKGRCKAHRLTTPQRGYDYGWQKLSKAARQAQPWCSRCGATSDLATDHVVSGDRSVVQVLCRSCNSKKVHEDRGYSGIL